MKIYFIYADGCPSCANMKKIIDEYQEKYKFEVISFESEQQEAIDYAIENGISDLPACKIANIVIQGENFNANELRQSIEIYFK